MNVLKAHSRRIHYSLSTLNTNSEEALYRLTKFSLSTLNSKRIGGAYRETFK